MKVSIDESKRLTKEEVVQYFGSNVKAARAVDRNESQIRRLPPGELTEYYDFLFRKAIAVADKAAKRKQRKESKE